MLWKLRLAFFSDILTDDFDAIVPSGGNTWSANVFNPGGGGALSIPNLTVAGNSVIIFAGGQALGGDTLGQGGPGGFSATGTTLAWFDTLFRRGESGTTEFSAVPNNAWQSTAPDEFAPWGGSITFDSDGTADSIGSYNWHYDHTTSPTGSQADFYSVAIHELGHALGLGTSDAWSTHIVGAPFSSQFNGAASVAANGGVMPALQTDLDPPGHWIEGLDSIIYGTTTPQETAMDPSVTLGTRKLFTELDVASLSDIGWSIIPEPSAAALLLLGAGWGLRRRRF